MLQSRFFEGADVKIQSKQDDSLTPAENRAIRHLLKQSTDSAREDSVRSESFI